MSEKDTLIVLGASYDSVDEAELDYETVKALYEEAGVGHAFDAAVLERGADGKVKVVDKHMRRPRAMARGRVWRSGPWPPSCRGSDWASAPRWARGSAPSAAISRTA